MFFSGTADALVKPNAVEESLEALREAIDKYKAENGVTGPASEIAEKPRPHPYWRSEISPHLFLPPDTVSDSGLYALLEGRGVAGRLHLRRQALLVRRA